MNRATRRANRPSAKAQAVASQVFTVAIDRAAAKHLLREVADQGLTPELHERIRAYLAANP